MTDAITKLYTGKKGYLSKQRKKNGRSKNNRGSVSCSRRSIGFWRRGFFHVFGIFKLRQRTVLFEGKR